MLFYNYIAFTLMSFDSFNKKKEKKFPEEKQQRDLIEIIIFPKMKLDSA